MGLAYLLFPYFLAYAEPAGDATSETERQLYVPYEDLQTLMEGDAPWTVLSVEEYKDLVQQASQSDAEKPPRKALFTDASYRIHLKEGRAILEADLVAEVLEQGVHALSMPLQGVGVRRAFVDQEIGKLARFSQDQAVLFLEGRGIHQVHLDLVAPVQRTAAQQSVSFQVPMPGASRVCVIVPGDVEVKGGATVLSRRLDSQKEETILDLLVKPGPVCLVLSLNSRRDRQDRVVVASSVLVAEVGKEQERFHVTCSLNVLHCPVKSFSFEIPADVEVSEVSLPGLSHWSVVLEEEVPVLRVELREEVTGRILLHLVCAKEYQAQATWLFPQWKPLDTAGHVAVLGVLLEEGIQSKIWRAENLLPMDTRVLSHALPPSVSVSSSATSFRFAVAYFSPQGHLPLTGQLEESKPELLLQESLVLSLGEEGLLLSAGFSVTPKQERRFHFDILLEPLWKVLSVQDDQGTLLPFEIMEESAGQRIFTRIPEGMDLDKTRRILLTASRVPDSWFDSWEEMKVSFPQVRGLDGTERKGALAVQVGDDLWIRSQEIQGLTALDYGEMKLYGLNESQGILAYEFDETPYEAKLTVARMASKVTAETHSFFLLDEEVLHAHYELSFQVERSRVRELSFLLPLDTPNVLSMRGWDQTPIKEFSFEQEEQGRRWTVSLAEARTGKLCLHVDFQMPWTGTGLSSIQLPVVQAQGVDYQSGYVIVEGQPELNIALEQVPRQVDVGELVSAYYEPGKRLLGVFRFLGEPSPVLIRMERPPGVPIPGTIVESVRLDTVLSAHGVSQCQALFVLKTKAAFLRVKCPQGAEYWSVSVNGLPIKPQEEEDQLLIDLPASQANSPMVVLLVYEAPVHALRFWDSVRLEAPSLSLLSAPGAEPVAVDMVDVYWNIHTPMGYRLIRFKGTVHASGLRPIQPALSALFTGLVRLGGGVGWHRGLLGLFTHPLSKVAQDARMVTRSVADYELAEPAQKEELSSQTQIADLGTLDGAGMSARAPAAKPAPAPAEGPRIEASKSALLGTRSLDIRLQTQGRSWMFQGLGQRPWVKLVLVHEKRVNSLAWGLSFLALLCGLALTGSSASIRARYVVFLLVSCSLFTALPGALAWSLVLNPVFAVGCALIPYYGLASLTMRARKRIHAGRNLQAKAVTTVLLVLSAVGVARSEEEMPSAPVWIQVVPTLPPVTVPEDALVLPYTVGEREKADKIFVPYARYVELWNKVHPESPMDPKTDSPAYLISSAEYEMSLTAGGQAVLIEGKLVLDSLVEEPFLVPLSIQGGILVRAEVEGHPCLLGVAERSDALSESVLRMEGKGRHILGIRVRMPLERRGGWRVVKGRLPLGGAASLRLKCDDPATELRITGVTDQESYVSFPVSGMVESALSQEQPFQIEWRPRVAKAQVDPSLSATSQAVLEIREDFLKLNWTMDLQFRGGGRDRFILEIPQGYWVDGVVGENIKGWDMHQGSLLVELLQTADEAEAITVNLWREGISLKENLEHLSVPCVSVQDAIRHNGVITVWRSPWLDVRQVSLENASRTDSPEGLAEEGSRRVGDSPLGLRVFQSYAFGRVPYGIAFTVGPEVQTLDCQVQCVFHVGEKHRTVQAKVILGVKGQPLFFAQIRLASDVEVDSVSGPGPLEWSVEEREEEKLLRVYLGHGHIGQVPLLIRGKQTFLDVEHKASLPWFEVLHAQKQEGLIAVLADPSYDVQPQNLENIDRVLSDQALSWLSQENRALLRLVLGYSGTQYRGEVVLVPRKSEVHCMTVTNVRVTDRAVEETILLDFDIPGGGMQEVVFRIPKRMQTAEVRVPLLREKRIEGLEDSEECRVHLLLQDEIRGQLRVLVFHDSLLSSEVHQVPMPRVEKGWVDYQVAALESASRDEVVVLSSQGFDALSRQQKEWEAVAPLLQGGSTVAYLMREDAESPLLSFHTQPRQEVETAGASIGLASLRLFMDSHGAYCGEQTFHVNNRTEQFLEVRLPDRACLWTVSVAGEPVKPCFPGEDAGSKAWIPLVKTDAGDVDYTVALVYGGQNRAMRSMASLKIPVVEVSNIHVERNQAELYLPTTHSWFGFTGNMTAVSSVAEFAANWVAYQNDMVQRLIQESRSYNAFAASRAMLNLGQMSQQADPYAQVPGSMRGAGPQDSARLQNELGKQSQMIVEATQAIKALEQQGLEEIKDNRTALDEIFKAQVHSTSKGLSHEGMDNFSSVDMSGEISSGYEFNEHWLAGQDLNTMAEGQVEVEDVSDTIQADEVPLSQLQVQMQMGRKRSEVMAEQQGEELKDKALQYQEKLKKQEGDVPPSLEDAEERLPLQEADSAGLWGPGRDDMELRQKAAGSEGKGLQTATGWSSLDMALPSPDPLRWQVRWFQSLRGETRLTGRAVSKTWIASLKRIASLFLVLGMVGVFHRRRWDAEWDEQRSVRLASLTLGLGVLGLVFGFLPLWGAFCVFIGLVWKGMIRLRGR